MQLGKQNRIFLHGTALATEDFRILPSFLWNNHNKRSHTNSLKTKLVVATSTFLLSLLTVGIRQPHHNEVYQTAPQTKVTAHVVAKDKTHDNYLAHLSNERVIYTCRLGTEESPAIQIAEIFDQYGNPAGVTAHVYQPEEIHLLIEGATAKWGNSSISAQANGISVKVIYRPQNSGEDKWLLELKGDGVYLKQTVKSCTEISDE